MDIYIREYQPSNYATAKKFTEDLQDYIVKIDNMKRERMMPGYGVSYMKKLLGLVKEHDGVIYMAEVDGESVGWIVGWVYPYDERKLLECVPTKAGIVEEVYVRPKFQNKKIGTKLMKKLEEYFRKRKCTVLRVEVFAPNRNAYKFYGQHGFKDRMYQLAKKLKK